MTGSAACSQTFERRASTQRGSHSATAACYSVHLLTGISDIDVLQIWRKFEAVWGAEVIRDSLHVASLGFEAIDLGPNLRSRTKVLPARSSAS